MAYDRICISSGHGLYVRGASGILDEVDEARLVVEAVADKLLLRGVEVTVFHDDVSRSQNENLERIVDFHNEQVRDVDVSVHFNAYEQTSRAMGVECLYYSDRALAGQVSAAISDAGDLIDRGPKQRTDLYFLTHTAMPAILIETCFVDSTADAELYRAYFEDITEAIAEILGGEDDDGDELPPPEPEAMFHVVGKCSYFGGANDQGVSPDEGLAFIADLDDAPHLFMPSQPPGTTGLARRLNSHAVSYVACRWVYSDTPKEALRQGRALVRALKTGRQSIAWPADWGPHEDTGRVADLSPWLMMNLGIETDDEVEVIFPYAGE